MSKRSEIIVELAWPLTKADLICEFAKACSFPPYWASNWDSFEECLAETIEDEEAHILVDHIGWNQAAFELMHPYGDIIAHLKENLSDRLEIKNRSS